VDRYHRQFFQRYPAGAEGPPPLAEPDGFRPFMCLGKNDDHHPDHADDHQDADEHGAYREILPGVSIDYPDSSAGRAEGNNREKTAAAVSQGFVVNQQQGKDNDGYRN